MTETNDATYAFELRSSTLIVTSESHHDHTLGCLLVEAWTTICSKLLPVLDEVQRARVRGS